MKIIFSLAFEGVLSWKYVFLAKDKLNYLELMCGSSFMLILLIYDSLIIYVNFRIETNKYGI